MDNEKKEKIKRLANLTKEEIGYGEENVKINFIVPLLECFGHNRLEFEHKYKDILIKAEPSSSTYIIIETKSYKKDLDKALQQLERYCNEERPLLGIIANGEEIRIYSPEWKRVRIFSKKIIYSLKRKNLMNDEVIKRLYNILSKENIKNESSEYNIDEREKEIKKKRIEIKNKNSKMEKEIAEIKNKVDKEIKKIYEEYCLPEILDDFSQQPLILKQNNMIKPKKLGKKGHDMLNDYVLPAIKLINNGFKHTEAFKKLQTELDVTYQTVNAQCTRRLGLKTNDFTNLVQSGKIIVFLKDKFPKKSKLIEKELKNLIKNNKRGQAEN